jgi:two-component system, NtrC family, response regulator GlrR
MHTNSVAATWVTEAAARAPSLLVRRSRFEVIAGPDRGLVRELALPLIRVGGRPENDLTLSDRRVSGMHFEVAVTDRGYRIRDLESTNGTTINGVRVGEAMLPPGVSIAIGKSLIRFDPLPETESVEIHPEPRFGRMLGASPVMRKLFADLARIATSDATVLVTGESGTGKELVAEAVHEASRRSAGPLVVVDCGAIPGTLFENELFGHERGSFTGADRATAGAFERAEGGTLFLDEIGELPVELQPKLLRALQSRQVRRIGGARPIACDVRIVAATNRDLAREVNRGGFREDLYYRLAVARVHVPPLRDRPGDVSLLVHQFLEDLGADPQRMPSQAIAYLESHTWPGNVRELRNAVERLVIAPDQVFAERAPVAPADLLRLTFEVDMNEPFKDTKQRIIDEFDRAFMEKLLARHGNNMAAAARATGVDRVSIYKVLGRLGLRRQ